MTSREKFEALRQECSKYDDNCSKCPLKIDKCAWSIYGKPYSKEAEQAVIQAWKIFKRHTKANNTQIYKADDGKPQVALVPMQIVLDIARIREYGAAKYKTVDNWKNVEKERYINALGRHALKFLNDPTGVDEESGLPHLWHLECNAAFLSEMLREEFKNE